MNKERNNLEFIIEAFVWNAELVDVAWNNRPHLAFSSSDLAYSVVSGMTGAKLRRAEYTNGRYIPIAEIETEHYTVSASGKTVTPKKEERQ